MLKKTFEGSKTLKNKRITVIGFGKTGSHLYYALKKTGYYAAAIRKHLKTADSKRIESSDVIFICTQDSKIKEVVKTLSNKSFNLKEKIIIHCSGALTSKILKSLKQKGASTASFHPVQTFISKARTDEGLFKNIYIAVEGDKKTVTFYKNLSKKLGAKPFSIRPEDKILHHINCVFASNFLVTLLSILPKNCKNPKIKIPVIGFNNRTFFNIYEPLTAQTLQNISKKGLKNSLTGPIARGDTSTIKLHLSEIKRKVPELESIYKTLAKETEKLVKSK